MRTVPFKTLFDGVVRRLGLDPLTDIGQDVARAIVQCINERVDLVWPVTILPEITLTKEMGFRPVWQPSVQYHLNDEILFHVDKQYYVATGDPPINESPATSAIWHPLEQVEPFIDMDFTQTVYGIYKGDPSVVTNPNGDCSIQGLAFQPSARGVKVIGSHGNTVWVWAGIPIPQYSIAPWIDTKPYLPGDIVYLDARPRATTYGRCYTCLVANTGLLNAAHWGESVVPRLLLGYLLAGATADCLRSGKPDQLKIASAAVQDAEADRRYQALVDLMTMHGYKPKMVWPARAGCCCNSGAWLGDEVIPITVNLLGDVGGLPIDSTRLVPVGATWEYHPEIKFLRTVEGTPSLAALPTTTRNVSSIVEVVIAETHMVFQLIARAADPGDSGEVAPDDYASVANNKCWLKTN